MQACLYTHPEDTLLLLYLTDVILFFVICFKVSTLKHILSNFQNYVHFKEYKVYIYTFIHQNAMP